MPEMSPEEKKVAIEAAIKKDQHLFDLVHYLGVAKASGDTAMEKALSEQLRKDLEKIGISI